MFKKLILNFALILLLVLFSCESSAPEIAIVHWQLVAVNDLEDNIRYEKLVVYLQASDEDGDKDLDKVYIINDENELFWEIPSSQWIVLERDGLKWYGYADFVMHDKSAFPRGNYRFMITDVSGERDDKEIYLNIDRLDLKKMHFPSIKVEDDKVYVDTKHDNTMTIIYDYNKRYITGNIIEYDVTPLREFPDYTNLYGGRRNNLYLYVTTEAGYGLLSGPFTKLIDR